jgi:hypothetical protein
MSRTLNEVDENYHYPNHILVDIIIIIIIVIDFLRFREPR